VFELRPEDTIAMEPSATGDRWVNGEKRTWCLPTCATIATATPLWHKGKKNGLPLANFVDDIQ
jgi:hypothetical protein